MPKSKIIKSIAIANFVFWIGLFLLYRAGYLDEYIFNNESAMQSSPNGGAITDNNTDTVPKKSDTVLPKTRMSSSKSFIITDNLRSAKDSAAMYKRDRLALDSASGKELRMMSGSKSGMVFNPNHPAFAADSIKRAAAMKKKQKQKEKEKEKQRQ